MATILLVDDSESIRAMLAATLAAAGHDVATATDGRHALRLLRHLRFQVVVTDIYMPEADGLEVISALARCEPRPAIIAMSSVHGDFDMLEFARRFGAVATLRKPFPPEALVRRIRELVPEQA